MNNNNAAPRKRQSAVSLQANAIVRADEADARLEGDDGMALMSAEEHKAAKLEEALKERRRLDRLLAESHERFAEERRRKY